MGIKRILVSGAGGSAGNNFIKSLRMAKEKFYIVGTDSSKYYAKLSQADNTFVLPSCSSFDYIDQLNAVIKLEKIEFVHPQPDTEVKVISDNRDRINAKTFLPLKETIDTAQDKFVFNKKMEAHKIPVPKTELVQDVGIWHGEKKWLRASFGAGSLAALPVSNTKQMEMWISHWQDRGLNSVDFILSEFLPGKEFAFQSIWKDGQLITSAARQRIEYLFQNRMPSGQSSTPTIAKSVHNNTVNLVAYHGILALDPKATGIFCVDLKENEEGVPCITEINAGRFFTTSNFFAEAGSNMPYYYVKMAYGEEIPDLPQFNAVPEGLYWVRGMDMEQVMVKEDELS